MKETGPVLIKRLCGVSVHDALKTNNSVLFVVSCSASAADGCTKIYRKQKMRVTSEPRIQSQIPSKMN